MIYIYIYHIIYTYAYIIYTHILNPREIFGNWVHLMLSLLASCLQNPSRMAAADASDITPRVDPIHINKDRGPLPPRILKSDKPLTLNPKPYAPNPRPSNWKYAYYQLVTNTCTQNQLFRSTGINTRITNCPQHLNIHTPKHHHHRKNVISKDVFLLFWRRQNTTANSK